ncbi:MAG: SDR family oxidoreductase [Alphaproteobacteria bacterium]|nr:SDR family oxidoreductase [Alphaproteobacteria bacterium]
MTDQAARRGADLNQGTLSGQLVVVTGAASGIGRETARAFCRNGASVVALDINEPGLCALREELACRTFLCDVTDSASVDAVFQTIAEFGVPLDILVSNAGAAHQGPIGDVPADVLRRSFDLNFFGHQNACQAALKLFRKQGGGGTILFNISNQSINPGKDFGPYGIPKAATLALMKQYALDHAADGIRANGVNAGRIRSDLMTDKVIDERAAARGVTPKQYMSGNLLGVEVFASDVADAFVHLAQLDKVNAAVLTVDGGGMATSLR